MLHLRRLPLRLEVQQLLQRHVQPTRDHLLDQPLRVGCAPRQPARQLVRHLRQLLVRHHLVHHPDPQRLRRVDDRPAQIQAVLRRELDIAIEKEQLFLEYQPQFDLAENKIIAAEALVRWRHPERGVLGPNLFIPIAENGGLIVRLGQWVLEEACRQSEAWRAAGLKDIPIAVNVSGVQFRDPDFPDRVINTLETAQLKPGAVELEFTESVLLRSSKELEASLMQLAENGIRFSLDDFGTGYSSLRYLRSFPVHKLKIAGEFVRDVLSNPDAASIVEAVIGLGHKMDLKVVAEEVETPQTR